MVGMPYPTPTDPELQERMRFMNAQQQQHALRPASATEDTVTDHTRQRSDSNPKSLMSQDPAGTSPTGSSSASAESRATAGGCLTAGREYYEDLCMKAVNQCIGRVIRHKDDHAAIVLADARWCTGNANVAPESGQKPVGPLRKLPAWIQGSLTVCRRFGDAYGRLHQFHRQMLALSKME